MEGLIFRGFVVGGAYIQKRLFERACICVGLRLEGLIIGGPIFEELIFMWGFYRRGSW